MGGLIIFILFACVAVGVCLRVFPKKLPDIRFRATDAEHAFFLVHQFAEGTYENRFGYPTGFFYADEDKSEQPFVLEMKEAQPRGSITDSAAATVSMIGGDVATSGGLMGCFMGLVILGLGMPFILISAWDRAVRWLIKSSVIVQLREDGEDTVAEMTFRGPSAYLVASRYEKVFGAPTLPEDLRPAAAIPSQPLEVAA